MVTIHNNKNSSGFTLIEVILAVVLLGAALSIILGLQSSAVTQAVRNRNKETALLFARQILASLEANEASLSAHEEEKPLSELALAYIPKATEISGLSQGIDLSIFSGKLSIQDWPLPEIPDDGMRVVRLTVSWGPSTIDSIELVYFAPKYPQ